MRWAIPDAGYAADHGHGFRPAPEDHLLLRREDDGTKDLLKGSLPGVPRFANPP